MRRGWLAPVQADPRGGALGERSADELSPFKMQVEAAASRAEQHLEALP